MKKDIHPQYFNKAIITCACGAKFTVGSTVEKMEVEICSQCHPFYSGQKKLVDTTGQVQKFKKRLQKTQNLKAKNSKIKKFRKKLQAQEGFKK
ncbi:MAG: 50S ribosomal protein L31 [Candidatus Pacebacteria bacterium]|nr:50S ribosomal protein L31 [Candidatus Paceibacterota bacterium]